MDPLKKYPFVVEYLDKLQAHTGAREVSPALRILLEQLGLWFSRMPPSPLQLEVDRAAAADLRLAPPGQIQWRPGDAVFYDPSTGKHVLRNGTAVEVRPTASGIEEAIAAKTREMATEAAVGQRFQFSPETLRKKGPPLEVANVEIAPFVISDHPSAQELVDQLIADAEAEARSKEGVAPECPLCKLEISDVNDPKVVQPIRGGYVHVACHDRTFGTDLPPTPSTTILSVPITLKTLDHEALTAGMITHAEAEKRYGSADFAFKAPPGEMPIADLTGPGVSQAHLTCERCNGSGTTGPELGTCGECKGTGGRVVDLSVIDEHEQLVAMADAVPPDLTPEQLAAAVCDHCGEKGHTFWACPRMVHF